MPAGLVLILVVGSLLVAMFLNADATLRKSEAKGDGWRVEDPAGVGHDYADQLPTTDGDDEWAN